MPLETILRSGAEVGFRIAGSVRGGSFPYFVVDDPGRSEAKTGQCSGSLALALMVSRAEGLGGKDMGWKERAVAHSQRIIRHQLAKVKQKSV